MQHTRLVITPGEPAGIGPDLVLDLIQQWHDKVLPPSIQAATLILIADQKLLNNRAKHMGLKTPQVHMMSNERDISETLINLYPLELDEQTIPGTLNVANAAYLIKSLELAVHFCESEICQGMVTGPIQKSIMNDASIAFSGHTEWLAERTKTSSVVMSFASPKMKLALATTHLPLREVPDAIQAEMLLEKIQIIHREMKKYFAISHPRILVCGLNPHAGEGGYLGREEIDTIGPVIKAAQKLGISALGPIPADTAFTPESLAKADIVLAMYHDQGLTVLKHEGFSEAANITLGLPIIRTSVDHGTALDIAGSGTADIGSLLTAIEIALEMASHVSNNNKLVS